MKELIKLLCGYLKNGTAEQKEMAEEIMLLIHEESKNDYPWFHPPTPLDPQPFVSPPGAPYPPSPFNPAGVVVMYGCPSTGWREMGTTLDNPK
jgi:hypothetical protein